MKKLLNRNLFLASIKEIGYSTNEVAKLLGISKATLYRKINGNSEFSHSEINNLRNVISEEKIRAIFFSNGVS